MFTFYLQIYRKGVINFCGSIVDVEYDVDSSDGKFAFREYDNGRFKFKTPKSKHPNILQGVIIGKKGWGLWIEQWSQGIVEWSFTKEEILNEFDKHNIQIPEPLMLEWDKLIDKKKRIRNLKYLEELSKVK